MGMDRERFQTGKVREWSLHRAEKLPLELRELFDFKLILRHVYRENKKKGGESRFQYVVPVSDKKKVLESLHDSPMAAHMERDKTLEKFRERFYWPRSYSEVVEHVRMCSVCQQAKPSPNNAQPLTPIRVTEPFELITIDIVGPILPFSGRGNKYILVMANKWTKHVDSDGDGHTERLNRTLEGILRCFIQDYLEDWDEYLKPLAFAYNTAVHATTGLSPFQMVFGFLQKSGANSNSSRRSS